MTEGSESLEGCSDLAGEDQAECAREGSTKGLWQDCSIMDGSKSFERFAATYRLRSRAVSDPTCNCKTLIP